MPGFGIVVERTLERRMTFIQNVRGIKSSKFKLEFTLAILFLWSVSPASEAIKAEDDFVERYGNDPNSSGKWKPFSRTRNMYPEIMKNVCIQAHKLAGFGPPTASVRSAYHARNALRCLSGKYKTILVDYIKYGLGIGETNFTIPYIWYLTKGLRPDCVFYLDNIDFMGYELQLTNIHICGIRMPEWPDIRYNDTSEEACV